MARTTINYKGSQIRRLVEMSDLKIVKHKEIHVQHQLNNQCNYGKFTLIFYIFCLIKIWTDYLVRLHLNGQHWQNIHRDY